MDDVFILCIQGLFNWSVHLLPEMAHSYLLGFPLPPSPTPIKGTIQAMLKSVAQPGKLFPRPRFLMDFIRQLTVLQIVQTLAGL